MAKPKNGWTRRELAATLAAVGAARILPAQALANPAVKVPAKLTKRQKDVLKKAVADTQTALAKVRGAVLSDDVPPAFVIPMPEKREKRS
jgi:hypothetical protein